MDNEVRISPRENFSVQNSEALWWPFEDILVKKVNGVALNIFERIIDFFASFFDVYKVREATLSSRISKEIPAEKQYQQENNVGNNANGNPEIDPPPQKTEEEIESELRAQRENEERELRAKNEIEERERLEKIERESLENLNALERMQQQEREKEIKEAEFFAQIDREIEERNRAREAELLAQIEFEHPQPIERLAFEEFVKQEQDNIEEEIEIELTKDIPNGDTLQALIEKHVKTSRVSGFYLPLWEKILKIFAGKYLSAIKEPKKWDELAPVINAVISKMQDYNVYPAEKDKELHQRVIRFQIRLNYINMVRNGINSDMKLIRDGANIFMRELNNIATKCNWTQKQIDEELLPRKQKDEAKIEELKARFLKMENKLKKLAAF